MTNRVTRKGPRKPCLRVGPDGQQVPAYVGAGPRLRQSEIDAQRRWMLGDIRAFRDVRRGD